MGQNTPENMLGAKNKVKVYFNGEMGLNMKEILLKIIFKEMAFILGRMEELTTDSG